MTPSGQCSYLDIMMAMKEGRLTQIMNQSGHKLPPTSPFYMYSAYPSLPSNTSVYIFAALMNNATRVRGIYRQAICSQKFFFCRLAVPLPVFKVYLYNVPLNHKFNLWIKNVNLKPRFRNNRNLPQLMQIKKLYRLKWCMWFVRIG